MPFNRVKRDNTTTFIAYRDTWSCIATTKRDRYFSNAIFEQKLGFRSGCVSAGPIAIRDVTGRDTSYWDATAYNNGYGYYSLIMNAGTDTIYTNALCRGDVEPNLCMECVNEATLLLSDLCPYQKSGILYRDKCMLKYSNETEYSSETLPSLFISETNSKSSKDAGRFAKVVHELMHKLIGLAAKGNINVKFAGGSMGGVKHAKVFVGYSADVQM
ncbi:cysteine-rich receptor-like protein kinase 28 [Rutidosis leptorrhynchoides]|uniref:cysteine-rich receptor-like protein kinase 28 n=1 Tax=Rutidosis leptorrhynchoides TaxID=125765 RepID=UPI003A99EAA0